MSLLETLEVDGSYGEGGGQILRVAASLSIITGTPIHVTKIRAGRDVPGLRPQHAVTMTALRDISGARLEGARVGSTEITFVPARVESRSFRIDLGTAGSIALVLQAVVPSVSLSGASLEAELVGGTDVPWSPTADYLREIVFPALRVMGIEVKFIVKRRGYYPKGGGLASVMISPSVGLRSVNLPVRESSPPVQVTSRCGSLPRHVAERQATSAVSRLRDSGIAVRETIVSVEDSASPGSSVLVSMSGEKVFVGSDVIGARGRPAEKVGEQVAEEFVRAYESGATVDSHLGDMLVPLLALTRSKSTIAVPEITEHMKTSIYVAKLFTRCEYAIVKRYGFWQVSATPGEQNS